MGLAAGGATTGAGVGSIFGPVGTGVGAGVGGLLGGVVDFLGQQSANQQNWDQFVSNQVWNTAQIASARDYNTYMANTVHEREMDDLRRSGLNPILAANGGNPAPTAPVTNPGTGNPIQSSMEGLGKALGRAIPDALSATEMIKTMQNADADTTLKAAQAATQTATAQAQTATARNLDIDSTNKGLQTGAIKDEAEARSATAKQNAKYADTQKLLDMITQTIGGVATAVDPITHLMNVLNQMKNRNANTQIKGMKGVPVP